ncbi:glucose-6-phosphate dehydrogenase-6-phosphogluconolactonase, putative [Plasmodium chabaudi chabaudi]|uniref:glucose-6-phosphate dehydrogenase (NADP(+)) n=1 Tax=Plasmodium chabaudi chabaudi TaxID=31271 RepID=A0A4V0KBG2_PLACU|nr:glucose-6-phosphate dehydrogenase-6-phosphogluconolactonase, putative [Plasmodium chabaudi chabaudi]VTZ70158.1 glucose-6-phosphate dehydrogenase-6-phosphogluconolactonase, putative [Plasmodium chabaudi chabaudi]|eukprot:XP_016654516.1 glucose-6-phosphate dehydrogenase-6-phosphogluconolactonase, putative [Plasmodium chabaudi chabaudi]
MEFENFLKCLDEIKSVNNVKYMETEDLADFNKKSAYYICKEIHEKQLTNEGGYVVIGLSGGKTPIDVYKNMCAIKDIQIDKNKLIFFIIDERYKPDDHKFSNYNNIKFLFDELNINKETQLYKPDTKKDLVSCIKDYNEQIKSMLEKYKKIDIAILGMGSDFHIASLFPNVYYNIYMNNYQNNYIYEDNETIRSLHPDNNVNLSLLNEHVYFTTTNNFDVRKRITVSLNVLSNSTNKIFLLNTADKLNLWKNMLLNFYVNPNYNLYPAFKVIDSNNTTVIACGHKNYSKMLEDLYVQKPDTLSLSSDNRVENKNELLTAVIFGCSGDLAKKKIYPALFKLFCNNLLPKNILIIGFARTEQDFESFFNKISVYLKTSLNSYKNLSVFEKVERLNSFKSKCRYFIGNYLSPESFEKFNVYITEEEKVALGCCGQKNNEKHKQVDATSQSPNNLTNINATNNINNECESSAPTDSLKRCPYSSGYGNTSGTTVCPHSSYHAVKSSNTKCPYLSSHANISVNSGCPYISHHANKYGNSGCPYTITRMLYLALPPHIFVSTLENYKKHCLNKNRINKILLEKPFGKDLESFKILSKQILEAFPEKNIYRIDHYLGKDMVSGLLKLKFTNTFLLSLMNRHFIKCIKITLKETKGVYGRGQYFDPYGIIRDVMQNHMLQLLTLITMEHPTDLNDKSIQNEKIKILKSIASIKLEDTVIGQYIKSNNDDTNNSENANIDKSKINHSYLDDPHVDPNSITPTFCACVLYINSVNWHGVPIIFKTGKALNNDICEIKIQFHNIMGSSDESMYNNEFVIILQPVEGIYLKLMIKKMGSEEMEEVQLNLSLNENNNNNKPYVPEAYETLLLECYKGYKRKFISDEELYESWRIFTPLLNELQEKNIKPLSYPFGSSGPQEAYDLIKKYYNYGKNYETTAKFCRKSSYYDDSLFDNMRG